MSVAMYQEIADVFVEPWTDLPTSCLSSLCCYYYHGLCCCQDTGTGVDSQMACSERQAVCNSDGCCVAHMSVHCNCCWMPDYVGAVMENIFHIYLAS